MAKNSSGKPTTAVQIPVVTSKDGLPVMPNTFAGRLMLFCPYCLTETLAVSTTKHSTYYGVCRICATKMFLNTPAGAQSFAAWQRLFRDETTRALLMDLLVKNADEHTT